MNTPLLLTSVALLAGVAARPINNDRRGNDMRELVRSPDNDERQAFLGHIPTGFDSLNSLQLHDIHDNVRTRVEDKLDGSTSPKLSGIDSPDPDPGLDSPYMGPQRYLASIEQELESPALSPATPSAQSSRQAEKSQPTEGLSEPYYSPMVVPLVFASLAALVLLGLAVAVACVAQVVQRTVLRREVWQSVVKEKGGLSWSEKEKKIEDRVEGSEGQGVIVAREVPSESVPGPTLQPTKSSDASVDDPELTSLPDNPPVTSSTSSIPAVRDQTPDRTLGLAIAAWTYDNWVTHFMIALFGWFGMFLGGARADGRQ